MSYIFIYGPPGSGKTTLACSMTKLGYKVNIIDPDQKALKMMNIKPLIDSGKVVVTPIEAKLTESNMRQRILQPQLALLKQPKGYLAICDSITELEKQASEGVNKQNEVLVLDSLTSMNEHMKRLISSMQKTDKLGYDGWAAILANMEDFFYTMMNLQKMFKHVIIIAHDAIEKDEDTGRVIRILPAIEGSMKNKVAKYFEEVYHTRVEIKAGKASYQVATKAVDKADARTSRELETYVEADFAIIFKEELNGKTTT